jgi:Protein of unknown function (DUF1579)
MSQESGSRATGVAVGRVEGGAVASPELRALDGFIGNWMTEGELLAAPGQPAARIVASDVYEWAPGGHFVLHRAYGRIGETPVGAVEIIGYDQGQGMYRSHLYDSFGNATVHELTLREGVWTWLGAATRCRGVFSANGTVQTANHERTDDGRTWVPSMNVTLRKS